jgi:preprotein translocase subunit SecE
LSFFGYDKTNGQREAVFNIVFIYYMKIVQLFANLFSFLKEVRKEIKKINWPTKKETIRYTAVVVGISLAVAMFLGGLDFIFNSLITKFIFK